MGLSGFISRGVLRYILPSIIAVVLFGPFLLPDLSPTAAGFAGALLAYILFSPVGWLTERFYDLVPRSRQRAIYADFAWWSSNYDFGKVWYVFDKDEREYVYFTNSYANLYGAIGFYLLVYAYANVCVMAVVAWHVEPWGIQAATLAALGAQTPMLGEWRFPSAALAVTSVVAFGFILRDYNRELESLFGPRGHYRGLVGAHQRKGQSLATGIFGTVRRHGEPVVGATVTLLDEHKRFVARASTDMSGRYRLPETFRALAGTTVLLRVTHTCREVSRRTALDPRQDPEIDIEL